MKEEFEIRRYVGSEIDQCLDDLARLRIQVFREFPYLYDGSNDYEKEYLKVYSSSEKSIVATVSISGKVIGATTGLPLIVESSEFRKPFEDSQDSWDLESMFYFGESVVLPEYRGNGFGNTFFKIREEHALKIIPNLQWTVFCAVNRNEDHPMKPDHYKNLDGFWMKMGYKKRSDLVAAFEWKEIQEEKESTKHLTFWVKPWNKMK